MSDLVFEDPPPRSHGPEAGDHPLGEWLDDLRSHPNKWAKYPKVVHNNTRGWIVRGTRYEATEGEFEATVRREDGDPPSRGRLFVRYVGGES